MICPYNVPALLQVNISWQKGQKAPSKGAFCGNP